MSRNFATRETLQAAAVAVSNGAPLNVTGLARIGLDVSIAGTATVRFEATVNGTDWLALPMTKVEDGTTADHATASAAYQATVSGLSLVRARISSWTSGAVTVQALGT